MAAKKKRVAIFIDGSNFYFKVRSLVSEKTDFVHFNYKAFMQNLAGQGTDIVFAGYYVGVVRAKNDDRKAKLLRSSQQQLFDQLKFNGLQVITGFLMNHDGRFYEKGVDVRMAVDIVAGAYEKQYDEAIVVSSDTDLLPAVAKAMAKGRVVQYVGFSHQPSMAMVSKCSRSRLLLEKDILDHGPKPRTKIAIRRFED